MYTTESTSVAVLDTCFERFKEDVHCFEEKGKAMPELVNRHVTTRGHAR